MLELSSKPGEYELSACASFFSAFFLFFTLLFVLFAYEVQDCLFKALGFELLWEFFNETKSLSVSMQTSLDSLFQFWNRIQYCRVPKNGG